MKQRVHRLFGLQLGHPGSIGYAVDNISFDQGFCGLRLVVDPHPQSALVHRSGDDRARDNDCQLICQLGSALLGLLLKSVIPF